MEFQNSQNIIIECNGVLTDTMSLLLDKNNGMIAGEKFTHDQIDHDNLYQVRGLEGKSKIEIDELFHVVNTDFHKLLSPVDGARESLEYLKSKGHDLYYTISTPNKPLCVELYLFINKQFPDLFKDGKYFNTSHQIMHTAKSDYYRELGCRFGVEDFGNSATMVVNNNVLNQDIAMFVKNEPWNKKLLEGGRRNDIKLVNGREEIIQEYNTTS